MPKKMIPLNKKWLKIINQTVTIEQKNSFFLKTKIL